jgi:hypothetical protein
MRLSLLKYNQKLHPELHHGLLAMNVVCHLMTSATVATASFSEQWFVLLHLLCEHMHAQKPLLQHEGFILMLTVEDRDGA